MGLLFFKFSEDRLWGTYFSASSLISPVITEWQDQTRPVSELGGGGGGSDIKDNRTPAQSLHNRL